MGYVLGLVVNPLAETYRGDPPERCIEADEKPVELTKVWENEAKTKPKEAPDPMFLFKKKVFLKDDDKEMADLVARNLVYIQVCFRPVTNCAVLT